MVVQGLIRSGSWLPGLFSVVMPRNAVIRNYMHCLIAAIHLRALYTVLKQNIPKIAGINRPHSNSHKIGMRHNASQCSTTFKVLGGHSTGTGGN